MPCLKFLTIYYLQKEIVYQAVFLHPAPNVTKYYDLPGVMLPKQSEPGGSYPLYLAMEKGHLPSWNKLYIDGSTDLPILRAGHLNRVKELEI